MCTRVKQAGSYLSAGAWAVFKDSVKQPYKGVFGFNWGEIPNARDDKYSWWMKQGVSRGLFEIESFFEKGGHFVVPNYLMTVAAFYRGQEFALITTQAMGDVAKLHHRMPAIIVDEDEWIQHGKLLLLKDHIVRAA